MNNKKIFNKELNIIIPISLVVLIIDQLSKFFIVNKLKYLDTITIIKNFFYITYAKNTGGAWSILEGKQILLIFASILFLLIFIYYITQEQNKDKMSLISYAFLIGGILGNLIDRIINNYVIDFISLHFLNYYFPIFNIADSFIVLGFIILLICEVKNKNGKRD